MGRKPVAGRLTWMQPLPLVPPGSIAVAEGVAFLEDDAGTGTVFVWGQACFTWDATDPGARRLAAVQLVTTRAASQRQVAHAFSVNETTLWRWRSDYSEGGLSALLPEPLGPKRPSKLTSEKIAEIRKAACDRGESPRSRTGHRRLHRQRGACHRQYRPARPSRTEDERAQARPARQARRPLGRTRGGTAGPARRGSTGDL